LSHRRYYTHPSYLPFPAKHVTIRGVEEEKYAIVDIAKGTILEEVEISRALFEIYEGAVVSHLPHS
jgi:DEAD/DEAH box helicase domain-containing protein